MTIKYKDYYQVLGVKRDAEQEQIQRAYRRQARKYHPDVSKESDAAEQFSEAGEAYEVLRDPEKRKRYDELGANWKAGQDFRPPPGYENFNFEFRAGGGNGGGFRSNPSEFSNFFESVFGGKGAQGHGSMDQMLHGMGGGPAMQEAAVTVSLADAYHGVTRTLKLQGPNGTKTVDVKIPPGVTNGTKIRLGGEGLLLKIIVAPDSRYEIEGHNLVTELRVAPWEAALGAKVPLQTLDGQVTITVPPNTPSGSRLRLANKGLAKQKNGKGNLYATLKIVTPATLTQEEKELFEKLQKTSKFDPRG